MRRSAALALVLAATLIGAAPAGAYLYWDNIGTSSVARAENDGANANTAFISTPVVFGLTSDGTYLYVGNGSSITRTLKDGSGGTTTNWFTANATTGQLAIVGTSFYAAVQGAGNLQYRTSLSSGPLSQLAPPSSTGQVYDGMTTDGTYLYYAMPSNGNIGRVALDGSGANPSFITGGSFLGHLAVSGNDLFWSNRGYHTIGHATLNGSAPATGVNQSYITDSSASTNNPYGLATDGKYVYWSNYDTGTLGRANVNGKNVVQSFITGASNPSGIYIDQLTAGGSVGKSGNAITFADHGDEASNLTVTLSGGNYIFDDAALSLTPAAGCVTSSPGNVSCPASGVTGVTINASLGADVIDASGAGGAAPFTINGAEGNDTIIGSSAADTLNGGVDNDTLDGGNGADKINGGDDDDVLRGGSGDSSTDRMTGGLGADSYDVGVSDPGIDRAIYSDTPRTTTSITVGDGLANDGSAVEDGSADNVSSEVESVTGSSGADTVTGSGTFNNTFSGGGGNDTLNGGPGGDFLAGGLGNDAFTGGDGSDRLTYHLAGTGYTTTGGVTVTEDNTANDGVSGETDNVGRDIEILFGSDGNDTLNLSGYNAASPPNGVAIAGLNGDDTLIGTAGNDYFDGGANTAAGDKVTCNGGTDILISIEGPNTGC